MKNKNERTERNDGNKEGKEKKKCEIKIKLNTFS